MVADSMPNELRPQWCQTGWLRAAPPVVAFDGLLAMTAATASAG